MKALKEADHKRHQLLRPCRLDKNLKLKTTQHQRQREREAKLLDRKSKSLIAKQGTQGKHKASLHPESNASKIVYEVNNGINTRMQGFLPDRRQAKELLSFGVFYEKVQATRSKLDQELVMGKWHKDAFGISKLGDGLGKPTWIPTSGLLQYLQECQNNFDSIIYSFAKSYKLYVELCNLSFFRDYDINTALAIFSQGMILEMPNGWLDKFFFKDRLIILLRGLIEIVVPPTDPPTKPAWPKFILQEGDGLVSDMVPFLFSQPLESTQVTIGSPLHLTPKGNCFVLSLNYSKPLEEMLARSANCGDLWIFLSRHPFFGMLCDDSIRLVARSSRVIKVAVGLPLCTEGEVEGWSKDWIGVLVRGRAEATFTRDDIVRVTVDGFTKDPYELRPVIDPKNAKISLLDLPTKNKKGDFNFDILRRSPTVVHMAEGRIFCGYRMSIQLSVYLEQTRRGVPLETPYTVAANSSEVFVLTVPIEVFKTFPKREILALLDRIQIEDISDSKQMAEHLS